MRAKAILVALIPLICFAAKPTIFEQFRQKIDQLESKLHSEKDIGKRYDAFLQTQAELVKLRKNIPRQNELDELSMSLYFDTLADLPAKKFDRNQCDWYRGLSHRMMASQDKTKPDDPMVVKGWKIIDLICAK